jgi:aminoglycoside phosphotransferase (APT) family kinase protein
VREAEITVEVVSCLIAELFPRWADLEIRPVDLDGWDNTTFRHGDEMSVGGEPAGIVAVVDHDRLVEDLGAFLAALQAVDADGGPPPGPHSIGTRMGSSTTSSPITA